MLMLGASALRRGLVKLDRGLYPITGQRRLMSHFNIKEHVVRCQHTRDRPAGAERGRENELKLLVKQYVPKTNTKPKKNDVTIIGAQANGFPKEMYEPFWDDMLERLQAQGRGIRGIWIADIASQGQSGILNEVILGPDASWLDHGRDLLYLINQFQDDIPHPIIGIGHSVGASHLTHLSLLHPRLLDGLILIDPILQTDLRPHTSFAKLSTNRRDVWPSRKVAAEKFRSNKYYQTWDPRVLDKWIEYGLRDLPTEQYPEPLQSTGADGPPVTLTTTIAQEVHFYLRAYYRDARLLQDENFLQDIHPEDENEFPLARPEMLQLYRQLPEIKPSVLYIFGRTSEASPREYRLDKMTRTGTGVGGSGGAAQGRVQEVVLDCGHLAGMEKPTECAAACVEFMQKELDRWEARERERDELWEKLSRLERVGINDLWRQNLGVDIPRNSTKL